MLHILTPVFWWSVGIAGVLLIYASLSYETEDGKIQSLLEDWWIRVDDFRQHAISVHIALMKVIASVLTRLMDRIFGNRLFGLQAFGVSSCFSLAWVGLTMLLLTRLLQNPQSEISSFLWLIGFGLIYGSLPALVNTPEWRIWKITFNHVWFACLVFMFLWNVMEPFGYIVLWGIFKPGMRRGALALFSILLGVLFSIFLFTTFVAIMRITLGTIARSYSPLKIAALSFLNTAPLFTFYGLIKLLEWWPNQSGILLDSGLVIIIGLIICGILFNFSFVFSSALFVCLAIIMILHRLFWPAISRPLYKLQALGIAKRPKVFAAIGLILVGLGFGKHEWLWFLISKF